MTERDDRKRRSALHYAALANDTEGVRELVASGEDPNATDADGFTPLHFAAQEWSLGAAEVLLEHGALVDAVNLAGNTPLFVAVFNSKGRRELIDLLRSRGADPRRSNMAGQTPVGLARLIANYPVAEYFDDIT